MPLKVFLMLEISYSIGLNQIHLVKMVPEKNHIFIIYFVYLRKITYTFCLNPKLPRITNIMRHKICKKANKPQNCVNWYM